MLLEFSSRLTSGFALLGGALHRADEQPAHLRPALARLELDIADDPLDLPGQNPVVEIHIDDRQPPDRATSEPSAHGRRRRRRTCRSAIFRKSRTKVGIGGFSDQQALGFVREHERRDFKDRRRSRSRPRRRKKGSPVSCARDRPSAAATIPAIAAPFSSNTINAGGSFDRRYRLGTSQAAPLAPRETP